MVGAGGSDRKRDRVMRIDVVDAVFKLGLAPVIMRVVPICFWRMFSVEAVYTSLSLPRR